jgi:Na+-translocating ferredoxin:NAD+ oxidoreductase RNF subunit RnfB
MYITIDTIFGRLPHTDCGDCGEPSCRAFALAFATDRAIDDAACPHLGPEVREALSGLKDVFRRRTHLALIVDEDRCTACDDCVVVCPVNMSLFSLPTMNYEAMPLVLIDDVVKVENYCGALNSCLRCVEVCPVDAIKLV